MGKTTTPLHILVHPDLWDCQEVQDLVAKGHTLQLLAGPGWAADVILGPTCWRLVPELVRYLDVAVKAAQRAKRPPKKGKP